MKRTPLRRRTRIARKPARDRGEWIAARDAVLAEEPRCRACGAPSVEVHHIMGHGMGKRNHARENLMGICRRCHDYAENHPKAWRERFGGGSDDRPG